MISTNEGRGGTAPRVLPNRRALRRSLDAWKRAAIGLFVLAVLCNVAQALVYGYLRGQLEQELQLAEESRDSAIQELAAASLASAQENRPGPPRRQSMRPWVPGSTSASVGLPLTAVNPTPMSAALGTA